MEDPNDAIGFDDVEDEWGDSDEDDVDMTDSQLSNH
jgi:hypothetical protein